MKKFLTVICVFCILILMVGTSWAADAKYFVLSLGSSLSGNTTASKANAATSGTSVTNAGISVFAVTSGTGIVRSGTSVIGSLGQADGTYYVFQVTGVTISQAAQAAGGDFSSGNTITVRYRESILNSEEHWKKAQATDIISGMALSGNTKYLVEITPIGMGFIRFELVVSGQTPYDGFSGLFVYK